MHLQCRLRGEMREEEMRRRERWKAVQYQNAKFCCVGAGR